MSREHAKINGRFNEAEAFTPRIQRWRETETTVGFFRFNEAEAFTPRILSG